MVLETVVAVVLGTAIDPAYLREGRLLLPLVDLATTIGGEVKEIDGVGEAFCKGDLCIPLTVGQTEHTLDIEGVKHVYLDALADALNLDVSFDGNRYRVRSGATSVGVAAGDKAPGFALPDLFTGEMVSSSDYLGRKVVFYAWASW